MGNWWEGLGTATPSAGDRALQWGGAVRTTLIGEGDEDLAIGPLPFAKGNLDSTEEVPSSFRPARRALMSYKWNANHKAKLVIEPGIGPATRYAVTLIGIIPRSPEPQMSLQRGIS